MNVNVVLDYLMDAYDPDLKLGVHVDLLVMYVNDHPVHHQIHL